MPACSRLRKALDLLRQFPSGDFCIPNWLNASTLKPEVVSGLDILIPARTDRRSLFRRVARDRAPAVG